MGNLEWIEFGLREAFAKDACKIIEGLLNESDLEIPNDKALEGERCYCARSKEVQTLFGIVHLRRNYYYKAQHGRVPMDQALGLVEGYSPAMVRLMCRAGAQCGYEMASQELKAYTGMEVEGREIQRMIKRMGVPLQQWLDLMPATSKTPAAPVLYISPDGTGVPMIKAELEGRKGKQADGSSKTREVKLGVVFTQHGVDDKGMPLRDPGSSTYVGSFEPALEFGLRLRDEARRRGLGNAQEHVFLGDGASWVWEIARLNFHGSVKILDFYHAKEHLGILCQAIWGIGTEKARKTQERWAQLLLEDRWDQVLKGAQKALPSEGTRKEEAQRQIAYFEKNRSRITYGTFRKKGYFIGSGVIESGCKVVVGKRLKQSGMFWSVEGAQKVLSMRCALLSGRFDEYWDHRNQQTQVALAA